MLFATRVHGGTLHVFAENLGGTSYGSPSADQQTAYASYAQNHESRSVLSAGSESWLSGASEPAATATVTYDAESNSDMFSVQFLDWNGDVLKSEQVAYGNDATPPADPTREGWHFTGWSGNYTGVTQNVTITATYAANSYYTVRFLHENGTVLSEQQVAYQGAATAPANPAPLNENRVFYKWSCDYSSVTNDLDVVAVFVNKVVEIDTGAKFAEYMGSGLAGNSAVTLALTADISLSGVTYSKPSAFSATLDGRGHTLRNFPSGKNIKALCGTLKGTVRDLRIVNYTSPTSVGDTALLASSAQGAKVSGVVLSNCTWTLPSASHGTAGFFTSTSGNTVITNCVMENCRVTSTGSSKYLGGFVGSASNTLIVDCRFTADDPSAVAVGSSISIAGAIVGKCGNGVTIRRCTNNARVKVTRAPSGDAAAGGLVGGSWSSGSPTIVDCANFGAVEATAGIPVGGIIGEAGTTNGTFTLSLRGCFNYGNVSSPLAAGGIAGSYMGATSKLLNCGNMGAVSSDSGFAGGIVGRIRYNGNTRTAGFNNMMQAGVISTVSGYAGIMAGGLAASTGSDLTLVVSNSFLAGSAVATGGGKTGLAFGGRDTHSGNALAVLLGGSKVLVGNASLPLYYDGANSAFTWDSPATFASTELINRQICEPLDGVAEEKGWMRWIQGREYPELALFGNAYTQGIAVIFY